MGLERDFELYLQVGACFRWCNSLCRHVRLEPEYHPEHSAGVDFITEEGT